MDARSRWRVDARCQWRVDARCAPRHDRRVLERVLLAWCLLVTCALPLAEACEGAPTPAAPAKVPAEAILRARLEFDTGESRAAGLTAFDLDGDGRAELISLVRGPGLLRVWSGLSNRSSARMTSAEFPVGDFAIGPVRVGEWKPGRDGGPAIVAIAQRADPAVTLIDVRALFLGTGDPLVARIELESRPRAIASGDLGLDGVFEIAVVTLEDELLLLRNGRIDARFALADAQTTCVAFPADGRSILVGSQGSRTISAYAPKSASEWERTASVRLEGLPRCIDEIAGWRGAQGSRFLVACGDDAVVWLTPSLSVERTERVAAVPIDLVHAGVAPHRARLAVSIHGQQASIELEDGGAAFTTYAGQHPTAGALGDFDGDGHIDVALANGDAKRISVIFARAEGGWNLASTAPTGRSPHSIDVGDFDGDGRPDVVALCAKDATVRLHSGTESGLSAGISQGFAESANRVRARDLDGDGRLDIAFLREVDGGVLLDAWFGDGTGHLWMRGETAPILCATSPGDLLIADIDSDGTLEAIVTDPGASKVVIVAIEKGADGIVRFGAPREFDVAGAPIQLAFVASPEGAIIVAAALSDAPPRGGWSTWRLTRTELTETYHQTMDERARALAVDAATGTLAYVGGGDSSGALSLYGRDTSGGGNLAYGGTFATGLRAFAVRSADLDGDGRGDVVVSAQNSHHLNLWLGADPASGAGLIRLPDIGVGTGPLDVLLTDLDGDGVPEIVSACAFSNEIVVVHLR